MKTINIYYNNKPVPSVVELKNKWVSCILVCSLVFIARRIEWLIFRFLPYSDSLCRTNSKPCAGCYSNRWQDWLQDYSQEHRLKAESPLKEQYTFRKVAWASKWSCVLQSPSPTQLKACVIRTMLLKYNFISDAIFGRRRRELHWLQTKLMLRYSFIFIGYFVHSHEWWINFISCVVSNSATF